MTNVEKEFTRRVYILLNNQDEWYYRSNYDELIHAPTGTIIHYASSPFGFEVGNVESLSVLSRIQFWFKIAAIRSIILNKQYEENEKLRLRTVEKDLEKLNRIYQMPPF